MNSQTIDGFVEKGINVLKVLGAKEAPLMESGKKLKGFALMSPEKRAEIAGKGGRAAHEKGTAHKWKVGEQGTRDAGRKGGQESRGGRGKLVETPSPTQSESTPPAEVSPAPDQGTAHRGERSYLQESGVEQVFEHARPGGSFIGFNR